jgi:hypothetical protein
MEQNEIGYANTSLNKVLCFTVLCREDLCSSRRSHANYVVFESYL